MSGFRKVGGRMALTALVGALPFLLVASATARQDVLRGTDLMTITDPTGKGRILLAFDDANDLAGRLVTSAFLEIPLPGLAAPTRIDFKVAPITTAWHGVASWQSPWRVPGGDWDDSSAMDLAVGVGANPTIMRVNVTDAVRDALGSDAGFHGFLLMPGEADGRIGFDALDRQFLGVMSDARLVIDSRRLQRSERR